MTVAARLADQINGRLNGAATLKTDASLPPKARLRFAIDWSVLFSYAYPGSSLSPEFADEHRLAESDEAKADIYHRQRIALTIGINTVLPRPIVVLPPHLEEIRDHLYWRMNRQPGEFAKIPEVPLATDALESFESDQDLRGILAKVRNDADLNEKEIVRLANVIENKYPAIWWLFTTNPNIGPKLIDDLFRTQRLATMGTAFDDIRISNKHCR